MDRILVADFNASVPGNFVLKVSGYTPGVFFLRKGFPVPPITLTDALPNWFDSFILNITGRLPNNWFGLRLAILLRKLVTVRMARDGFLDVQRLGLKLRLHPRDNGCEKGFLFTPQMYERPERRALEDAIAAKQATGQPFVFVDVGANVGLFSFLVAASARNSGCKIIAIEPEPENLRRLRFNLSRNKQLPIIVEPVAVGPERKRVTLVLDNRDRGGNYVDLNPQNPTPQQIVVECVPLLEVIYRNALTRVDALKIDIEGNEDVVLGPFFDKAPVDLWPKLLIIEDTSHLWALDLFGLLAQHGYKVLLRSKLNVILAR